MATKQLKGSSAPDGSQYVTLTDGAGNLAGVSADLVVGTSVLTGGTSGALLYDNAGLAGETAGISFASPNASTGRFTFDTTNRVTSNVPILDNEAIVIKNSVHGTAGSYLTIQNHGDTIQPGKSGFHIYGGNDESHQLNANCFLVYPAPYNIAHSYSMGDVVDGGDNITYTSQLDSNIGNALNNATYWVNVQSSNPAYGVMVYEDKTEIPTSIEFGQNGLQLWVAKTSTIGGEIGSWALTILNNVQAGTTEVDIFPNGFGFFKVNKATPSGYLMRLGSAAVETAIAVDPAGCGFGTIADVPAGIFSHNGNYDVSTYKSSAIMGHAAIATNATDGFLYLVTCPGTPTGTPTAYTGRVPMVYDTTAHKIWVYDGGAWKATAALT